MCKQSFLSQYLSSW